VEVEVRAVISDYDEAKFIELVLYVADRLRDDRAGGATKLNKALYFADFAQVRRTGRPITGAEYQRLPHGPAPRRLIPVRRLLIQRGEADVRTESFLGYEQQRLLPRRPPDTTLFTDDEMATIDGVLDDLAHLTALQVSDLSHEEPGWRLTRDGEVIPFETALIAKHQPVTPTARALAADVTRGYGIHADQ
jgi:uncharacterized phage-associated protein